jgi:opacity protein-like surface antigen
MRGRATVGAAVLIIVAVVLPAHAGDFESPLDDGAWAIQFGIGDDFRLTTLEGTSLALKRHLSDKSCIRSTMDLVIRNEDGTDYPGPTRSADNEFTQVSISLALLYQRYFSIDGRTAMYFGAGPTWGYNTRDRTQLLTDTGTDTTRTSSNESEIDDWNVGGVVLLGAEWFASHTISLHCEYLGAVRYSSFETTNRSRSWGGSTSSSGADSTSWTVSQGDVRFGLSVYF